MSQPPQKNFLFVSNRCQHSKRLIQQLQQNQQASPLLQQLNIINIDDPRIQLPPFVQCVPTLYVPSKKHVLTDTHLFDWVNTEIKNLIESANTVKIADITGDASILPFQSNEMGNGLSGASYSFIEDDKNDLMNQNYSFLVDRDINKMPEITRYDGAPKNTMSRGGGAGAEPKKTGGATEKAYDAMMKARGMEMQRQMPQTPNFASPY
jgi:hypothetical protein